MGPYSKIVFAIGVSLMAIVHQANALERSPQVEDIIKATPNAEGLFARSPEGDIRHIQSHMICPKVFPNMDLWHLRVIVPDGSDVGCDYGRNGANNSPVAKLTIYAVRLGSSDTPDTVFARYQAEVRQNLPNAKVLGPAIIFPEGAPEGYETVRSEEYEVNLGERRYISDLVTFVSKGWVVEIRATFPADSVADMALSALALEQMLKTVGHP